MARNAIVGNWKQLKGKFMQQWGRLTDDDLDVLEGRNTYMNGRLQVRHGVTQHEAEKRLKNWKREFNH